MNVLIHDFGGHAFTVQLARRMAERGHEVHYVFSVSVLTPQGELDRKPNDPDSLHLYPIDLGQQMERHNLRKRRETEMEHGRRVAQIIRQVQPQVVLSGNSSLDPQRIIRETCRSEAIPFIFWLQDLWGVAASRLLKKKLPVVGGLIGAYYQRMERKLLSGSDRVVVISEDFRRFVPLPSDRVVVIENWAAMDHLPVLPRENEWGDRQGLSQTFNFLYSGTLGMKHNPELMVQLALAFRDRPDVRVVVTSEGSSIDWLRGRISETGLENLVLLPFQPFSDLAPMLATADVLIAILEPDAGVFSVPSKVLSYHCAARPLLLAVPPENLASKIVAENQTGMVVAPTDADAFVAAGESLYADAEGRVRMAANARAYAERTFDIDRVCERFESIFAAAQQN